MSITLSPLALLATIMHINLVALTGVINLVVNHKTSFQRCVSGGRTITANNEKQYVEERIQDFDAVSLYPSAMSIMSGVPKCVPEIISYGVSTKELLDFDQIFIEINIK